MFVSLSVQPLVHAGLVPQEMAEVPAQHSTHFTRHARCQWCRLLSGCLLFGVPSHSGDDFSRHAHNLMLANAALTTQHTTGQLSKCNSVSVFDALTTADTGIQHWQMTQ